MLMMMVGGNCENFFLVLFGHEDINSKAKHIHRKYTD